MSGPLLELRSGHLVVLQVTIVRQLVDDVSECFTICFFCPKSRSPLLARASPLTPVVSDKQLDPAILVVPFSSVAVRSQEVSKEPEVQRLRHQWLDHVLLRAIPFLMSDVQEVSHSHLHLHACPEHEPDMLGFALTWQRIHVSLGDQVDHSI